MTVILSQEPGAARRPARWQILCAGSLALVLTGIVAANSLTWIGSTAPGFFVLPNGAVSAVALPTGANASPLFWQKVLAVDGRPLGSSTQLYDYVRRQAAGDDILYTVRSETGAVEDIRWPTHVFSLTDYAGLFGVQLLTGLAFLGVALGFWWLRGNEPSALAIASASSISGLFFITAVDRFDPHWFLGLHLMAQALAVASLAHLALVFPVHRMEHRPVWVLPLFYLLAFLFGLVYAGSSADAVMYEQFHLVASLATATCATGVVVSVLHGAFGAPTVLARRQSTLAAVGILAAMTVVTLLTSMVGAGPMEVSAVATASLALPAWIAYAATKNSYLAIDAVLRRVLTYAALVLAAAALCGAVFFWLGPSTGARAFTASPIVLSILTFLALLTGAELRDVLQAIVDRRLFDRTYEVEQALTALSHALSDTATIEAIDARCREVFSQTIRPTHTKIFTRREDDTFRAADWPKQRKPLVLPTWRIARLGLGELQIRQSEEGRRDPTAESSWSGLDTEILVPLCNGGLLAAVVAIGPKESGRPYNAADLAFLGTAAKQLSLALSNVEAASVRRELIRRVADLEESLERRAQERIAALQADNAELGKSLEKLQYAYVKLEQSQANLLRSDRLATLGRLTAGLAHEMNTPLSAVLNSLKLIRDLSEEYETSIDDEGVLREDHHEIATELIAQAQCASDWANKAAAFIRSVKAQGREAGSGAPQRFAIRDVVTDARGLVAHRLRFNSCRIDLIEEPLGITLDGDPSRFNQVLVNLITNAIDAYEDRGMSDGAIEIRAWHRNDSVCVEVRDWAGGIPTSILSHIFDELYTTKGPGRGTGLGLWISRNIVEESLGGTLDVITNSEGSCFIAEFPQPAANLERHERDDGRTAVHAA